MIMDHKILNKYIGNIDLFLLDQILKGRFNGQMKILDAGCGEGRNLQYFLNERYDIFGIDNNPASLRMVRYVARSMNISSYAERFVQASLEAIPFPDKYFDAAICISVLHFADSDEKFLRMIRELGRILKTSGLLIIGMLTDIGTGLSMAENRSDGNANDPSLYLLSKERYESILHLGMYSLLENLKIHSEMGVQSMAYLVLEKRMQDQGDKN